jgi:MinD-like ATPase involved in chromosome partitioning or flagellar assembly
MYVLASGKGGVGQTTTALSTGIALGRVGYNTVVGDAAIAGLTTMLGSDTGSGVHRILAGIDSIKYAVAGGPAGLTVVPGETSTTALDGTERAERDCVVKSLTAAHDVVLVSTGPGIGPLHQDASTRAGGTGLVTTADEQAIAAAEKTAGTVAGAARWSVRRSP